MAKGWTIINGSLPAGLTLNEETGMISGTPTVSGTFIFTVKVEDFCGSEDEKEITITVCAKPQITSNNNINTFVTGESGFAQLTYSGSTPVTWSISSGSLPTGLSLNTTTGIISGTPTVSGNFSFTVKIENSCGEATQTISMFICAKPNITSSNTMNFVMGDSGSVQLTASGSTGTWSITDGNLPNGLSLNATTGVISGTPTVFGGFIFTVKVTNDCGEATQEISMTVCGKPEITTSGSTRTHEVGEGISLPLAFTGTTGGSWSVTSGALPTGLSLNATTGVISGTMTAAGDFYPTITYTNACGSSSRQFHFKVEEPTGTDVYHFDIDSNHKIFGSTGGTQTIQVTSTLNGTNQPWKYV